MPDRRTFIKQAGIMTTAMTAGTGLMARSYRDISGSGESVNIAVIGVANRGMALMEAAQASRHARLSHICDVDRNYLEGALGFARKDLKVVPETEMDFRKILDNEDIDAVAIATPDHWHAPMSILALQAGKHVYVEKPCSHNPHETELLMAMQEKSGRICQMGNQQRSSRTSKLAVQEIREGIIGEAYLASAYYYNARKSIGTGKPVAVPDGLDWDLWQGPAPREEYRDNIHPYNWHWFKTWGTGEIHNNGTHEIDVARWALGVDYPMRVSSSGGRMHHRGDDWEYSDTQLVNYTFGSGKLINWEGISCNGYAPGKKRGVLLRGTKGSVYLNRRNYILYDLDGKQLKREKETDQYAATDTGDLRGFDDMSIRHFENFVDAIRGIGTLNSPIRDAGISTQLCHLGNMAHTLEGDLETDPSTGRPPDTKKTASLWKREYEQGWEPKL